jgi:hypothetical protein
MVLTLLNTLLTLTPPSGTPHQLVVSSTMLEHDFVSKTRKGITTSLTLVYLTTHFLCCFCQVSMFKSVLADRHYFMSGSN